MAQRMHTPALVPQAPQTVRITSPVFTHGGRVPDQYTCEGDDFSPPLHIDNLPPQTESLALIMDDPDAPGGRWVHWTFWNLPEQARDLAEGTDVSLHGGTEGETDNGQVGYHGPCPPAGRSHRYQFKVFALDDSIDLPGGATVEQLEARLAKHTLAWGQIVGVYGRK